MNRGVFNLLIPVGFLLAVGAPSSAGEPRPAAEQVRFFETRIRPLLEDRCLGCHGPDRQRSDLRLDSAEGVRRGGASGTPLIDRDRPEASLLLRAVRHEGDAPKMPPKGKLSDREITDLTQWVKAGTPFPPRVATEGGSKHWAFQPPARPTVPDVRDADWPQTPVDRFILAGLEAKGLRPAPLADRRALIRRATFDLIGLPPTPEEVDRFLADRSPDAFARVVDRLLASPAYGERWGRHWLDVVRYADARDLIQLPEASDFREAWRYRDWVVRAFNRDLPYSDFVRHQIAGDLLPPPHPGGINRDGVVATGFLAIADFVPGDVDKEQMIADYVNDQIDVVSRAFLGIGVACARCHHHKFDPISTEDYYGLAGIFFSTRLIPGPVAGNTPLIRVPLASPAELAQDAVDKRRLAELEQQLPTALDREYLVVLNRAVTGQTARYLLAACEYRRSAAGPEKPTLAALAKQHRLHESLLAAWVAYLARIEKQPPAKRPAVLHDALSGKLSDAALERAAEELQQGLVAQGKKRDAEPPGKQNLAHAAMFRFRADDPQLLTDAAGRVTLWPNRAALSADASAPARESGPLKVNVKINDHAKTVLRFDGKSLLETPGRAPPAGSLFVVFHAADTGKPGQRLIGWEDANVGKHGLGLMLNPGGHLHVIQRNNGAESDMTDTRRATDFEMVSIGWGNGAWLRRDGTTRVKRGSTGISSDPAIAALRLGGPGSGGSPRFTGDIAEIRIYNRNLSEAKILQVETELRDTWFKPSTAETMPPRDSVAELYDELLSPHGPLWLSAEERQKLLPAEARSKLTGLRTELETLRKKPPLKNEQAVAVQDGGPKGTRHEGFKDAQVYLRGDPKRPGKTVPRGFPRVLAGEHQGRISKGSGRLELADWLTDLRNPLVARVMVNRIWQHHFGEGLVRTPNEFGQRGERPTHPELLDWLALRFASSGWSVKDLHRLILLSSVYQQSSRADAAHLARDPDNRLVGRMNRRRLEAEAIRDSLLSVAGRLDSTPGGPAFRELTVPRRTLYLMSVRTGPSGSDFGRLFDRADPGTIVDRRSQSIVAPQALFFRNDPAVADWARDLAARVARESPPDREARIRHLYALVLGRPPTRAEIALGEQLLAPSGGIDPWERYCHLILCTNEFIYLD
jgi:hypothetical protein